MTNPTSRPYYTLIVMEPEDKWWGIQFGAYERKTVDDELRDSRPSYPRGTKFKVIKTGAAQSDITSAVDALNKELAQ